MSFSIRFVTLVCVFLCPLFGYSTTEKVLVFPDNIEIKDKMLESRLIKAVKKNGTLTNTRQVNSYMLAVLCEYPTKGSSIKPYCFFKKVKFEP